MFDVQLVEEDSNGGGANSITGVAKVLDYVTGGIKPGVSEKQMGFPVGIWGAVSLSSGIQKEGNRIARGNIA